MSELVRALSDHSDIYDQKSKDGLAIKSKTLDFRYPLTVKVNCI
jgi:hypothetical protein